MGYLKTPPTKYWTPEKRREAIAAVRKLCDLLEQREDLDMPSAMSGPFLIQPLGIEVDNKKAYQEWFERNSKILKEMDAVPGVAYGDHFALSIDLGGVDLGVCINSEKVCDKEIIIHPTQVIVKEHKEEILKLNDSLEELGFTSEHISKILEYKKQYLK